MKYQKIIIRNNLLILCVFIRKMKITSLYCFLCYKYIIDRINNYIIIIIITELTVSPAKLSTLIGNLAGEVADLETSFFDSPHILC